MPKPYRGGCLCGAVRYQIDAEPALAGYCQCRDCQRETGGGHTCFVGFPVPSVAVTGTLRFHEVIADSGRGIRRGFCPTCGSPVLGAPDEAFGLLMIRAGSLDDPAIFRPQLVCYASRAQPWDVLDPALPRYAELPPDE
jgi:hypothetical protein